MRGTGPGTERGTETSGVAARLNTRAVALSRRVRTLREPLLVPALRRLWFAQVLSDVGDWAARLALSVLVYTRTGSAAATGITLAVSLAPWLGPGQLVTAWSERWPRRRVMVVADLVRAGMFTLAVLPVPVPVLLVAVFAAGMATPPFESARSALRPEISPPHVLGPAVALTGMTDELAVIAGYLAGGVVITVVGPSLALLVNAATFALSALIVRRLPEEGRRRREPRRQLRRAARAVLDDLLIRRAAVLVLVATLAGTGVVAVSAPLALSDLDASPAVLTGLLVLTSVTALAVTAALRMDTTPERLLRLSALMLTIGGAGLVAGLAGVIWLGGIAVASAGLAFVALGFLFVVISPANTLVSPRLPAHVRASAFALLMGSMCAAEALGATLTGLTASWLGGAPASAMAAVAALVTGAYALVHWGPQPRRTEVAASRVASSHADMEAP